LRRPELSTVKFSLEEEEENPAQVKIGTEVVTVNQFSTQSHIKIK
jgi:hypothetical protein